MRGRAVSSMWSTNGWRSILGNERRTVWTGIVLPWQTDGNWRTWRCTARDLDHPTSLVLSSAGDASTWIPTGAGWTSTFWIQIEAILTLQVTFDLWTMLGRAASRYYPFDDSSSCRLATFLVHTPTHSSVTLDGFEETVGAASWDVDSSSWFSRFSGGVFRDSSGVLAGSGHYWGDALRSAAGGATFVTG